MIKKIIGLIAILFISSIVVELVLRIFFPQNLLRDFQDLDAPVFVSSDILPFTLKEGAEGRQTNPYKEFNVYVKINNFGTRGPEVLPKTEKVKRILFLGDSFTYGYGVAETDSYPRVIEALCNKDLDMDFTIDVINAGYAAGDSPDSYYVYLFDKIEKIKPDLVVIGFCIKNDIYDLSNTKWIESDEKGLPKKVKSLLYFVDMTGRRKLIKMSILKNPMLYKMHIFLYSHSHFYVLLKTTLYKLYGNYYNAKIAPLFFSRWEDHTIINWEKVKNILIDTKKRLDQRNIPLVVVLINGHIQTVDKIWEQYSKKFIDEQPNRIKPNEEIIELCNNYGIYVLDLYQAFVSRNNQGEYYFGRDGHWNEKGHRLAAEGIYDYLDENKLLFKKY